MRLARKLVYVVIIAGFAAPLLAQQPRVISTRQNRFAIPFTIPHPRSSEEMPREVQLLVSIDQGANWTLAGRLPNPRSGRFPFSAPQDGEYWFFVRTVDHEGNIVPEPSSEPGLRVLVDTRQPELEVHTQRMPTGEIAAQWRIRDARVDLQSIAIEYQIAEGGPWKSVPVDVSRVLRNGQSIEGTTTWRPVDEHTLITVKTQVADSAGNRSVTQSQLRGSPATPTHIPASRYPNMESGTGNAPTDKPNDRVTERYPQVRSDGSTSWPADQHADRPVGSEQVADTAPRISPVNAPIANNAGGPAATNSSLENQISAMGIKPKYVDSASFELEYDVQQAGPAGVSRVDLWGTHDGGKTWQHYGTDIDRQSPFPVTVAQSGLHGFQLIIYPFVGNQPRTPQPGDHPQVWIVVRESAAAAPSGQRQPQGRILDVRSQ